jgi:transketolase
MTAAPRAAPAADLDLLCINTIRTLAMDAVEKANSGHPGTPMALAPLAWLLYSRILRHDPKRPDWPDRDRFVLSAGHASMLLYGALFLSGYDLSLDDLRSFRQWGSKTPGHPEVGHAPGVETTTGPLGQGIGNAVGMAIAEAHLAARFNRPGHEIVRHRTYAICSDGDLMEGVSHEAASLAGHLKLGNLICCYDDNHITIEGATDLAYSDDAGRRFEAYGWQVLRVADANDLGALERAIAAAQAEPSRPSLIIVRSHIGYGAPTKQDKASAHGAPLGKDDVAGAKRFYGWPADAQFLVPEETGAQRQRIVARGAQLSREWDGRFADYRSAHAEAAAELEAAWRRQLPQGWEQALPSFTPKDGAMATRAASQKVINAIAPVVKTLVGGSADLAESTLTLIKGEGDLEAGTPGARNMHFGIRELGMCAVLNGMALHGGVRPFGATFFVFTDYARPAIRLAALMGLPVIYVLTHDSIGLGEDGPTHQPVEHLWALRAIPNLTVMRPADANETSVAWRFALEHRSGPVALVLTRQKLPTFDRGQMAGADGLRRGGYILIEAGGSGSQAAGGRPDVILIGTGSEVAICVAARDILEQAGTRTRVVSMPSVETFLAQDAAYREQVLPAAVALRVSVEAGRTWGWQGLVGPRGASVGVDRFGASAPYERIYQELGLTAERVAQTARGLLGREA